MREVRASEREERESLIRGGQRKRPLQGYHGDPLISPLAREEPGPARTVETISSGAAGCLRFAPTQLGTRSALCELMNHQCWQLDKAHCRQVTEHRG